MRIFAEYRKNNGSITVEVSIIVPLVILSIASVIYMGLILYQRAVMQSAAEAAAEAGANAWVSGTCRLGTGKPATDDFDKFKLYRRFFDADKEKRLECIEEYALAAASLNELIRPVKSDAEAIIEDYAVYRKLEVRIEKQFNMPLGNFMRLFGGSGIFSITTSSTAVIDEPAELIRTTDFIIDLEKTLEEKFPEIKDLGEKSRDALNSIKENIEKFLD